MSVKKKIYSAFSNPRLLLDYPLKRILSPLFPDKLYLKLHSWCRCGYCFDLDNPKTFNEKMNWLKLHDRKSIYTTMVDKLAVKKIVANIIGEEYVVPLYAEYNSVSEIDFEKLPDKCVFKTNQDSGGAIIYKKGFISEEFVRNRLNKRKRGYYYINREWPYKNVKTKFFAEEFLDNGNENPVLLDYKFWCFNGVPTVVYVTCKSNKIFENFYDMDFNPLMIDHGFPRRKPEFDKPVHFELMKELAKKLSKNISFIRVDFFLVQKKVYFGEFTFYDWGGLKPFNNGWDSKLGNMLELSSLQK